MDELLKELFEACRNKDLTKVKNSLQQEISMLKMYLEENQHHFILVVVGRIFLLTNLSIDL